MGIRLQIPTRTGMRVYLCVAAISWSVAFPPHVHAASEAAVNSQVSPTGAQLWSIGATVVPMASAVSVAATTRASTGSTVAFGSLFWGGALIGPQCGYWYSGAGRRGVTGLVVRGGAFALAWLAAPTKDFNDGILPNPEWDGFGVWVLATGVIIASDVYDCIAVRRAVCESRRPPKTTGLSLIPTIAFRERRVDVVIHGEFW